MTKIHSRNYTSPEWAFYPNEIESIINNPQKNASARLRFFMSKFYEILKEENIAIVHTTFKKIQLKETFSYFLMRLLVH